MTVLSRRGGVIAAADASAGTVGQIFVNDTFTDANSTALTAHTGETGATWTKNTAAGGIVQSIITNRIIGSAGGGNSLYEASGTPPTADYTVEADWVYLSNVASFASGIMGRASTTAFSGYLLRWAQSVTAFQLYSVSAGTFTQLGSNLVISPVVSQVYHGVLSMSGTTISATIDAVSVASVTNSTWTSAGLAGIYQNGANAAGTTGVPLDNFKATSLT